MNKLKMLALTAMAAAALGTGALAAAPPASAQRDDCGYLLSRYRNGLTIAMNRAASGNWESAALWFNFANSAAKAYADGC